MIKYILLAATLLMSQAAMAGGMGNYSNGYRMGMITKFSVKGLMFKSGEGEMLMGRESTPYIIPRTKDTAEKIINPWQFSSTDAKMQKQLNQVIGEYVVIKYNQAHVKMLNVDTDYEVVGIEKPTKSFSRTCTAEKFHDGMKSEGARVGRIVKASIKGTMVNSYEIKIQLGNAGNQFSDMSISKDDKLFECAVEALKSAKKVKVTYSQSFINLDVFGRNTTYDVVKIEPLSDI